VKHKRTKKVPTAGAFVLGKQSFERISAVEGIRLSEGMRTRTSTACTKKLSPEETREAIVRGHRKD
jgi:hypothetical protein